MCRFGRIWIRLRSSGSDRSRDNCHMYMSRRRDNRPKYSQLLSLAGPSIQRPPGKSPRQYNRRSYMYWQRCVWCWDCYAGAYRNRHCINAVLQTIRLRALFLNVKQLNCHEVLLSNIYINSVKLLALIVRTGERKFGEKRELAFHKRAYYWLLYGCCFLMPSCQMHTGQRLFR